ncbi:MAG: glutamate--tRNA ligase [Candidatus Omnitrophota bacterium]
MTEEKKVRVRFAPSPTGYLHIGSARTALFNWLFARSKKGTFILRIEDTDKKRSKKKYLKEILESLKWLGLKWDGAPYSQSKRGRFYKMYAKELLDLDKAYKVKGGAVAFRMPKTRIVVEDMVRGPIEFDMTLENDIVILKSDGNPTYNFACVVDDIEMKITHVIRGDDHISNTPKQIALYNALGSQSPVFVHIPLILGEDRSRLSKRHGATSIAEYRESGYLPEAMVNFLSLLGWSPGNNREIMSRQEIIDAFSLSRIVKTSAVFNEDKFSWINAQHIKAMNSGELIDLLKADLKRCGYLKKKLDRNRLKNIVRLFKPRMKRLSDFCQQVDYLFVAKLKYDREAVNKFLKRKELKVIFGLLIQDLEHVRPFTPEAIERCCRDLIARLGIGGGDLIHPVRVAITGRSSSPGLFEVIQLLGKKETIKRLKFSLKKYCR